jgi:glucose/arabinose dehydrogenase
MAGSLAHSSARRKGLALRRGHRWPRAYFAFVSESWPEEYRGEAIIAPKGTWNHAPPTGCELVRAKFENGEPAGWFSHRLLGGKRKPCRRLGQAGAFRPDGGLPIANDTGGTIWKVTPADATAAGSIEADQRPKTE